MSKKSRRRNKILLGAAALFGASKLGLLGGKGTVTGAAGKDKRLFTDIAKKGVAPQKVNVKKSFPRLKVDSIGNVTKDGVTSVTKNTKTKFINLVLVFLVTLVTPSLVTFPIESTFNLGKDFFTLTFCGATPFFAISVNNLLSLPAAPVTVPLPPSKPNLDAPNNAAAPRRILFRLLDFFDMSFIS